MKTTRARRLRRAVLVAVPAVSVASPASAGANPIVHGTELPYLFDQPDAPFPATLTAGQQALAASMRTAWATFAASGNPSTRALPWPWTGNRAKGLPGNSSKKPRGNG